jgi:CDP-glycerol glycerophosphotransferase
MVIMNNQDTDKIKKMVSSIPKRKNLAVFFGRSNGCFIDNVKYFFLHCAQKVKQLNCIYISFDRRAAAELKKMGLQAMWVNSEEAGTIMASAGIVVCDDFSWKTQPTLWALMSEAKILQLWHGVPLKAIGFPEINSSVNMNPEKAEYLSFAYSGYKTVVSTSPFFTEHAFGRAFKAEEFVESGYPRNDVLMRRPTKLDMINTDSALYAKLVKFRKSGGKTVFFMPTFRDNGGGPFEDGAINIPRLSEFCQQNNIMFICKLHPYLSIDKVALPPNIEIVDPKTDAYPLLSLCDTLLTDYSSVYFDFLLVDKPIIFYPYDFEDYISKNRELLFDFDEMTPGLKVKNEDSLYTAFEDILLKGKDEYSKQRKELREKSFSHIDGNSAERLGEHIIAHYL